MKTFAVAAVCAMLLLLGAPSARAQDAADLQFDQCVKLYRAGHLDEALRMCETALKDLESRGQSGTFVGITWLVLRGDILGDTPGGQGDALASYKLALERETVGRKGSPPSTVTASILMRISYQHLLRGNYSDAKPFADDARAIVDADPKSTRQLQTQCLYLIASIYYGLADRRALPAARASLEAARKAYGDQAVELIRPLLLNSDVNMYLGLYREAEDEIVEAAGIATRRLPKGAGWRVSVLLSLAEFYFASCAVAQAERHLEEIRGELGALSYEGARFHLLEARILERRGKPEEGYRALQPAIQYLRGTKSYNPHVDAILFYNVSNTLLTLGRVGEAKQLALAGLGVFESLLGREHVGVSFCCYVLATAAFREGHLDQAVDLYRRALVIAIKTIPEDPRIARALSDEALVKHQLGQESAAQELQRRAERIRESALRYQLAYASERQRLEFCDRSNLFAGLNVLSDPQERAELLMNRKGRVLDSVVSEALIAGRADSAVQTIVFRLHDARREMHLLTLSSLASPDAHTTSRLAELQQDIDRDESLLARQASSRAPAPSGEVSLRAVSGVLPEGAVLLDYVRYERHLGNRTFEPHYCAAVIQPAGKVEWVDLGPAQPVDATVLALQAVLHARRAPEAVLSQLKLPSRSTDDVVVETLLRKMHDLVFLPMEKKFGGAVRMVVVSPDSLLNFTSFGTMIDADGKLLSERLTFCYTSSARDLVPLGPPESVQGKEVVVVANPDYQAVTPPAASASRRALEGESSLRQLSFPTLPHTDEEARAVEEFARSMGMTPSILTGAAANKKSVMACRRPRILHFATHGYFAAGRDAESRDIPPMYRAGLALAGAQQTVDALNHKGTFVDGLLTAAEVTTMDLTGTWLVVVSACDTGSGEHRDGEGVLGLRRAFVLAGAQNLVVTLWPVADQGAAEFMKAFYSSLARGRDRILALNEVQTRQLLADRKKFGLRIALQTAGAFVISVRGPLPPGTERN